MRLWQLVPASLTMCAGSQVDVNGGEHPAVTEPGVNSMANANGKSTGPGADHEQAAQPEAEAKPGPEAKADEAAEFWAALQGEQPETNGTPAAVSPP